MSERNFTFDLGLPSAIEYLVKKLLGLTNAELLYSKVRESSANSLTAPNFCKQSLNELGVSFNLPLKQIEAIKNIKGPLIFVANHPFGAIDALLLITLMNEVRSEFKFIGNSILESFSEFDEVLIPVKIMDNNKNPFANAIQLRTALKFLKNGGLVGFFPAGEVASFSSFFSKEISEMPWSAHAGALMKHSRATIIPVYFEGKNSALFQYAGLVFPWLRISLLVREMLVYRKPVRFKLGNPIMYNEKFSKLSALEHSELLLAHTYALKKN